MKRKKILLVMPYYDDLSTYPSIIQAVEVLNSRYDFCIVTTNKCESNYIKGLFCQYKKLKYFKTRNILTLPFNSIYFSKFILDMHADYIVCFTSDGVEAAFFGILFSDIFRKTKYIYYNLEILTRAQYQGKIAGYVFGLRKMIEKWFTRKSQAFIIQDRLRYEISKRYEIEHPNTFFLPNTYVYNSDAEKCDVMGGNKNGKKVLYVGALAEWSIGDVLRNLECLEGIDITFAGWDRENILPKYEDELNRYPNIKVIQQQLSDKEFEQFVNEYDIGLIYYSSKDENVMNMGLSSGKFFRFLSLGKPVIVKNLPGIANEVEKFELGEVVNDIKEVKTAAEKIVNKRNDWKQHILKIYKENYDYRRLLMQIVEKLER